MFERADWTLFRNLNTISQKAGVPLQKLRALVYKEIVDNAMDAVPGKPVNFSLNANGWFVCEDEGSGIALTSEKLAQLFSINRPLTSTKILRQPSRGALGNGLRVVVGTVMASGGEMRVETRNRMYDFSFDDATGTTQIINEGPSVIKGTRISIQLGSVLPSSRDDLLWVNRAAAMHEATIYSGKSSAWWYDSDSFYELFMAAGERDVRWLVSQFDGVKLGYINIVLGDSPELCSEIDRKEADNLMGRLRKHCKPVGVKKIGGYRFESRKAGEVSIAPGHGLYSAQLPFLVEGYAVPINEDAKDDTAETKDEVVMFVNATPITGTVRIPREGVARVAMFGCGLSHYINKVSRRRFRLFINVTIPYMPITTDGKEPNFLYMLSEINFVASRATSKFKQKMRAIGGDQREVILSNLQDAIAAASGNGDYRYSLRQLFYAVRPHVLETCENRELDYNYFARVITDYEAKHGELDGIYRDPRGTLYHPHLGRSIPIGTIAVEEYKRPRWTFNKILYCEKEGFFSVLQQVKWPERNDCALLSSKGFASRAVRDVLDLLGETEEEIQFFCIHDADASGTLIYQSLMEGTPARAARKVKIINLGLEPWTGVDMNLQVESFSAKRGLPVARYVKERDREEGENWNNWLQGKRIELNAMTSPQFLEWLDEAIAPYSKGKVIPPEEVLREQLKQSAEQKVREAIQLELLAKAGFEKQVQTRMNKVQKELDKVDVSGGVKLRLKLKPAHRWDRPVDEIADEVLGE